MQNALTGKGGERYSFRTEPPLPLTAEALSKRTNLSWNVSFEESSYFIPRLGNVDLLFKLNYRENYCDSKLSAHIA